MPRPTRSIFALAAFCLMGAVAVNSRAQEGASGLTPRVKLSTSVGDIILELDAAKAPITVLNFLRYGEEGYYNGTVFHRVIDGFMIQGGGYDLEMDQKEEGIHEPIKNEWRNGLKNLPGTIAMARLGRKPDSATNEFFINIADNTFLDESKDGAGYAVFGKVVEGADIVDKIAKAEVDYHPKYRAGQPVTPVETIAITSIELLSEFDRAAAEKLAEKAKDAQSRVAMGLDPVEEKLLAETMEKIEGETGKKFQTTDSGLMYIALKEGTGAHPKRTDEVKVHYTGWMLDGTEYETSRGRNQPATVVLNQAIAGWTEGVAKMRVGSKWKFIVPPALAYGKRGKAPTIPPDAVLIFEIELHATKPHTLFN